MVRCDRIDSQQLLTTWNEAFADYLVDTGTSSEEVLCGRMAKNGVDLDVSVGAFDGDRMVGFTLVGVGPWHGETAAFDAGTGIVPAYRGQGLAGRMLEHAVPKLRNAGVTRFVLEVIQANAPAIRAYTRAGFTATRELDCYRRLLNGPPPERREGGTEVHRCDRTFVVSLAGEMDWAPSWETSVESVLRAPEPLTVLCARRNGEVVGVLVHEPRLDWLMTLVVRRNARRQGVGSALLSRLLEDLAGSRPLIKAINVERDDIATAALLRSHGFELYASQYEMERHLP